MKKNKTKNVLLIIALAIVIVLLATLCYGYFKKATMEIKNPIVTMEVENYGTIKIELDPENAPESVANFVNLAQNGYYNGLTFHRIVEGFMIQGGGYKVVEKEVTNEETGEVTTEKTTEAVAPKLSNLGISTNNDREYCITGEFAANGYTKNSLKHEEGVISMARADYTSYDSSLTTESYNSATGQFFIMTANNNYLDGQYAPFGKVIEGMDIVHNIEKAEVEQPESEEEEASTPVENIVIKSVTVDTQGAKYNKPKTLEVWDYYTWIYQKYGIDLRSYSN
ncbi:MAG: peptidylprolyl isomerase [Clostridia bacterium]|nr:peptidylprolyl isomerase [Clostridia bacterium]